MKDEQLCGLTARFSLGEIERVQATITLTASMAFWKEALNHLEKGTTGYGEWQVKAAIRSVIQQAQDTFYERIEPEAKPR